MLFLKLTAILLHRSCNLRKKQLKLPELSFCLTVRQEKPFRYLLLRIDNLKFQLGSLSKDDGNGNDDARKQCSDWLNDENNRAARAARTLIQFFDVVGQMTT